MRSSCRAALNTTTAFARRIIRGEPHTLRRFHAIATIVWFFASFPLVVVFANSIVFVVWISLYSVVMGHWSAYQGAAAEIEAQS